METNKEQDQVGMIETVAISKMSSKDTVESLLQKYDDGRPDKIWSVGDKTKDGIIVSFKKSEAGYWYALTDTPSEWQKNNGAKNGWSWIFQLESIDNYSISEVLSKIQNTDHVKALGAIDSYFKEKNIIITRFWFPKTPGMSGRITLYVGDVIFTIKQNTFFWFKWWTV